MNSWCYYKGRSAKYLWRMEIPEVSQKSDWSSCRFGFDEQSFAFQDPNGYVAVIPFRDIAHLDYKGRRLLQGGTLQVRMDDGVLHEVRDLDLYNLRAVFRLASVRIAEIRRRPTSEGDPAPS